MNHDEAFEQALRTLPLVAILRGVRPDECDAIGDALFDAGLRIIEVPFNSPEPERSIERLARRFDGRALVGAGTVLTPTQAESVAAAGGGLVVMPHADPDVIRRARALGLACTPGVATPTEAFAALASGASALKAFPAEVIGSAGIKAWRAVLPPGTRILPVGGISPDRMAPFRAAGAAGFGLGSALYAPGLDAAEVGRRAAAFVSAWTRDGAAL